MRRLEDVVRNYVMFAVEQRVMPDGAYEIVVREHRFPVHVANGGRDIVYVDAEASAECEISVCVADDAAPESAIMVDMDTLFAPPKQLEIKMSDATYEMFTKEEP